MIRCCIQGDSRMQQSFYTTYYSMLMQIAIRYAVDRQEAEQWVHDGFLKVFHSLTQFEFKGSFDGWLKKIMVRVCLDNLRQQQALKNTTSHLTLYSDFTFTDNENYVVDNQILEKYSFENILSLLSQLNEKQRIVFNLSVFEAYSHKEIAAQLDITENHSYWLLHQARKHLKNILLQTNNKKEVINE